MKEYAVFGVGKTTEYKLLAHSDNLKYTGVFETLKEISMITLPDKDDAPALIIMPVKGGMAVGEVSSVLEHPIERRAHSCVHYYVLDSDTFNKDLKENLADPQIDTMFVHGDMYNVKSLKKAGQLEYKEIHNPKITTSAFYNSLGQEQKWKLFLCLISIIKKNLNVAIKVNDKKLARLLQADFYKILPEAYALALSSMTYGTCKRKQFNVIFTVDDTIPRYENICFEDLFYFENTEGDSYPFLKELITGTDGVRYDFLHSVFMTGEALLSLEEMEQVAMDYYIDNGENNNCPCEATNKGKEMDIFAEEETELQEEQQEQQKMNYVEMFISYLKKGNIELGRLNYLRGVLLDAYDRYGTFKVRGELREKLRSVYYEYMRERTRISRLFITEKEQLFVLLLLLTCEMTPDEQVYYYSRSPHFVKRAPYLYKEFEEFLRVRFKKKGRKRLYKIYKRIMKQEKYIRL